MHLIVKVLACAQLIAVIKGHYVYQYPQPHWPQFHECRESERESVTTVSGPLAPKGKILPGQLIFEDNFDRFNLNAWRHSLTLSGKGAFEFQWYHNNRSNSFVENGILYIRPTIVAEIFGEKFLTEGTLNIHGASPNAQCTAPFFYGCERTGSEDNFLNPIVSVRVTTTTSFNFKFGKVEVRAKMPTGDWLTPNLWLFPNFLQYGQYPVSGIMSMVESRGNENLVQNGTNIGTEQISHILEYAPFPGFLRKRNLETFSLNRSPGWNKDFHRYQVEWTPDHIIFSVDDIISEKIDPGTGFWDRGNFEKQYPGVDNPWRTGTKMAPFDEEFFLMIQLGVGGVVDFPDDADNKGGKPWRNDRPNSAAGDFWKGREQWMPTWNFKNLDNAFQIDYVRIWAV